MMVSISLVRAPESMMWPDISMRSELIGDPHPALSRSCADGESGRRGFCCSQDPPAEGGQDELLGETAGLVLVVGDGVDLDHLHRADAAALGQQLHGQVRLA